MALLKQLFLKKMIKHLLNSFFSFKCVLICFFFLMCFNMFFFFFFLMCFHCFFLDS